MMSRSILPDMLHCANPTVLERQRARALQQESFLGHDMFAMQTEQHGFLDGYSGLNEVLARSSGKIPDAQTFEQGWCDFAKFDVPNANNMEYACDMSRDISRTSSCPPPAMAEASRTESVEKLSSAPRKRKSDGFQCGKAAVVNEAKDKKLKACPEEESSKITEQTTNKSTKNKSKGEASAENSRDNSKTSEVKKPDYIHVRARRGQATDSHSLAERVRREKISERMRYLQDLVPGCNKITGKAGMLDEIINYVQSLQRQVEFLSMKLATVNPKIDFNIDNFLAKGLFPPCAPSFLLMGMSTEIPNSFPNPVPTSSYLQFNPIQEAFSCCGEEMGVNPSDMGLKRTISAPVSVPDTFLCPSSLPPVHPTINWDADFQSLNNMELQARLSAFASLTFTGGVEASNIKMEN